MVSLEPVLRGQVLPLASMEPCLFRHGKGDAVVLEVPAGTDASMEPCLFRHGKGVVEAEEVDPVLPASMEPCLFRHGKGAHFGFTPFRSFCFNGAMSFQTW